MKHNDMKRNFLWSLLYFYPLTLLLSCDDGKEQPWEFFERLPGTWQLQGKPVTEVWKKGEKKHEYTAVVMETLQSENLQTKEVVREEIKVDKENGEVYYYAKVYGHNEDNTVPFKLISFTKDKVVFENKRHDFPHKITYEFTSDQSLRAEISGTMNGKEESFLFEYQKKL
ncbi:MAG: hypothetical protein IPM47_09555 [Sphingobacteriales bacterium]|nr:MAG: hypothetical protein IPM47_09555 [Sphingobacteriales bacterium]